MATIDFTTSKSGEIYTIIDITTGADNPPYGGKSLVIVAEDGTTIYSSGLVSITQSTFPVTIDSSWTSHLAVVNIGITLTYYNGTDGESVIHMYALPTSLNIKVS